jgi:hypothetical protein
MGGWEMSDTPETDDLAITCYIDSVIEGVLGFRAVPIDDCRKLERERDKAREEAEEQARLLGMSAQRESDLFGKLERIKIAAENVMLQWDSPSWKLTEPTAGVIYRLRNAIGMDE